MKYIIIVPDGMADYPIAALQGKTPLEIAETPNMDFIVKHGILGQVNTIPQGMTPASDVANMSIFGYDPKTYYSGRGPLEAANLGIELKEDEIAFRCNLVTCDEKGQMLDYSAGHISTQEAVILINLLAQELKSEEYKFYPGISYRHLLVIKDNNRNLQKIKCVPPHDILNQKISKNLPRGKKAKFLIDLMERSKDILTHSEINKVRLDLGENPANMIWLWGQGKSPDMPKFYDRFYKKGAVISAVDLIKGLGRILGLEVIDVPGATGYYDTNYQGKADYAIAALKDKDFVYLHIESPDEAGHNGDLRMKITCIERIDNFIVGTLLKHFQETKEEFRILILPDHATPISKRTHTSDTVPFILMGKGITSSGFQQISEQKAKESSINFSSGPELINFFFKE